MLDRLTTLLTGSAKRLLANQGEQDPSIAPELAAAALLFEVIWADHEIDAEELSTMRLHLEQLFELDDEQLDGIVQQVQADHAASVGVFPYTRILNEHLSQAQKNEVVTAMWSIALADNHIDALEEHTIRRIAELLYVAHRDFISAKLAAKRRLTQSQNKRT